MPSRGQSVVLTYIAWDTSANGGKTGDAANHTLRWIKDGASSAPTNASSEIDTTNAPGAYKITLTTAECTCDTGTLAGKSSTANVSIVPISISFEQLPTVAAGETNGLPIVDSSGRAKANVEAINGSETSGNNATLNLKKLSVVNDSGDAVVFSATGEGPGISGSGLEIKGSHGEYGMKIEGGSFGGGLHLKANTNAHALAIYGEGIGNGVYVAGGNGGDGIRIYGGSNNKDAIGLFHYGTGHDFQGDIFGNISGSVGSLATQAKTDVNAEVDAALNTAIPGSPTAGSINDALLNGTPVALSEQGKTDVRTAVSTVLNTAIPPSPTVDSINERIVNIDEGGTSGGSSAADVWSYPTRTLTPVGLGGSVVIPVATITSIITEAFKKAGINSPSTDLMTRAQVQWLEEIRTDLWKRVKKAKFLQARSATLLVNGLAKYQNPSDFESDLTLEYATGSRYGTAQAGALGTVTLAATENAQQADLIGKEIVLLSGSASGQISYIVGYDSTTKVATVSPSFTVAPSTDSYLIIDQYKPLEEKPLWEQQNLPNQTGQGTPDRFFPVGNATDGEFILWPVPYRTDSQPSIVLHRYYADISEIDTTGTLFATLLAKWRNLWLLGLKWKALDDADDDKEPAAQKAYLKELQEITRANYGNDLMNVQTKTGDY